MENASTAPGSSSDSWTASGDALHRTLASSADPRCWLVIDPTVRQLDPDEPLAQALSDANAAPLPVPSPHPAVDASVMPSLTQLDSSTAAGSAAITASVADAHAECEPDALTHGSGRRIGGWLEAAVSGAVLGQHIASQMVQRRPDGRTTLLRWTDPAVLWAMWPVLGAQQQSTLLGPISRYQLLDPAGRLVSMSPPETLSSALPGIPELPSLGLSESQWMELDAIGALNQALQEVQPARLAAEALAAARDAGLAAAVRARELGFETQGDVAHFAEKAITVAPNFDTHPLIEQRLAQRDPDDYFKALVEDLDEKNWARIREESKAAQPAFDKLPEAPADINKSEPQTASPAPTAVAPAPSPSAAPNPAPAPAPAPARKKVVRKPKAKKKAPAEKIGSISACDQCMSSGLPIMLVRYTVVPTNVQPGLPGWAGADRINSVKVGSEFKYALRSMREGYVYLFYAKHARGTDHWECYTVGEDGCMRLQPSPQAATPQLTSWFQCVRDGHNNIRMHAIVIEEPYKCGPTWIAFSEHKWSDETLVDYTKSTKMRNKRMQTLHPGPMADGAKHSHGAIVSPEVIESVLEYAPNFDRAKLPDGSDVMSTLTRPDGSLIDASVLNRVSTRYPWHLRKGDAIPTAKIMEERGLQANGKRSSAHVLALWDATGITHELNGFCNDLGGLLHKFNDERALEVDAIVSYDALKQDLTRYAGPAQDALQKAQHAEGMSWYNANNMAARRASAARLPEPQRSRQLETCDTLDNWARRGVSNVGGFQTRLDSSNNLDDAHRAIELKRLNGEVDRFLKQRDALDKDNIENSGGWRSANARIVKESATRAAAPSMAATSAQPAPAGHYRGLISGGADAFRRNLKLYEDKVKRLIELRTDALIHWLEAPLFIDTLNDFHGQNLADGLAFSYTVADGIFGLGACVMGLDKINQWVYECKSANEYNLLWRAVALNQDEAKASLDWTLELAMQAKKDQILASHTQWVGYTDKTLKAFADLYRRMQGIDDQNNIATHRAQLKDGAVIPRSPLNTLKGHHGPEPRLNFFGAYTKPVNMHGMDKLMLTAGNAIFGAFAVDKLGEYLSEKIIQLTFSLRALVSARDSENLIAKQASDAGRSRRDMILAMRESRRESARRDPVAKKDQADGIREAYKDFKAGDHEGVAFRGMRDGRLAVVVMLIEWVNFGKLLVDCKVRHDTKSYLTLLASGMTISGLLLDVASYRVRDLVASRSIKFQQLKLLGGVLSVGSTLIGAWTDREDAKKSYAAGYKTLAFLQVAKLSAGLANAAVTAAVAYTHAAGVVAYLTGTHTVTREGLWFAVKVAPRAVPFIELRIVAMAAGWEITAFTFGLQVAIWCATPDALEVWVDHSAFGSKRWDGGYTTVEEQGKRLRDALVEIGVPQDVPLPQ